LPEHLNQCVETKTEESDENNNTQSQIPIPANNTKICEEVTYKMLYAMVGIKCICRKNPGRGQFFLEAFFSKALRVWRLETGLGAPAAEAKGSGDGFPSAWRFFS